ncbi:MFS transporter [Lentibacillus lipolyticus]|nr:MFS transporter [Lentibacillus lipolyticus]
MNRIDNRLTTVLLFWCALMVVSSVYVMTPLIDDFSRAFGVTRTMAAWPGSIFSFCYACGFLVFGPLSDRVGYKRMMVSGLSVLAVVTFTIGTVDGFQLLIILRALQGFAAATFAPAALSYVFDVYPREKQVTTVGFIAFGFLVAGVFGQIVASSVNQLVNWQVIFLLFGGIYAGSTAAIWILLPNAGISRKHHRISSERNDFRTVLRQRNFQLCYGITFVLLLTFIGMYTVLGSYLTGAPFQLSGDQVLLVRAAGLVGMVASPVAGLFVRRLGLMRVLKSGLFVAMGGLLLLGLTSSLPATVMFSVVYVAGISLVFPVIMALIGDFGGSLRAIAASLYTFILFIGATIGPFLVIKTMEAVGHAAAYFLLAAFLAAGLAASFYIKIRKPDSSG